MTELMLNTLLPDVLGRIEENVESGPVFWSLTGEVYPAMVDGIFEASLMSGVVQLNSQPLTLAAEQTYFSLQASSSGYQSVSAPTGIVAPIRLRAPYGIRKTSLAALDAMNPGWQQMDAGDQIIGWFPLGISGFGIYPQLTQSQIVIMDFLFCPINVARPYTGNEMIPLQHEFTDILSKYAAAQLRAKEGGAEAEEADTVYQEYLGEAKALSLFQQRIDSLVYATAFGGKSAVNPKTSI